MSRLAPRPLAPLTTLRGAVLAALLAGPLGAAACAGDRPPPTAPDGAPAAPRAAVLTHDVTVPFSGVLVTDPCTGEDVRLEGAAQLLITEAPSAGGTDQFLIHQNYQGVTGVGVTSGAAYIVGASVVNFAEALRPGVDGQIAVTNSFTLISLGPALDFTITYVAHITVDATGVETVQFEILRAECRG